MSGFAAGENRVRQAVPPGVDWVELNDEETGAMFGPHLGAVGMSKTTPDSNVDAGSSPEKWPLQTAYEV